MSTFKKSIKDLLGFAIPLITGQVGQMLLGIGDLMVAGRYSKELTAAIGVASAIFGSFLMLGLGLSYAYGPILAGKMGNGEKPRSYLLTIMVYSVLYSLAIMIPMALFIHFGIPYLGLPLEVIPHFKGFFNIIQFSLPLVMLYQGIKEYLQVQKDIWFANVLVIIANFTNIGLNIILCFGLFGFPELGGKGLAISTFLNRLLMVLALLWYVRKDLQGHVVIVKNFMWEAFKLGLPTSIAILIEVSIFTAVTVLIGRMDVLSSAAHNIILSLASFTFMFPLALSNATATLVALANAEGKARKVLNYAYAALVLALGFELLTMLTFTFFPEPLLSIYTDKLDVIVKGKELIFFAALFQIPDGIQATLSGILRGMKITRPVMILTVIGYWVVGLPLGVYLAFQHHLMAKGLWMGLCISLSIMAVLLFFLFWDFTGGRKAFAVEVEG